jgi:hypothetical protein
MAIKYYKEKYGKKKIDVMTGFNEACTNWQGWFLANADTNVVKCLGFDVNASDYIIDVCE